MKKYLPLVLSLSFIYLSSNARSYFINPEGNDQNIGNNDRPWGSFQKALSHVQPGDTVFIQDGVYFVDKPVNVTISGRSGLPIVFEVVKGAQATLQGERITFDDKSNRPFSASHKGILQIENANYITIKGLRVAKSHAAGILVRGGSNIQLLYCQTDETYNSGIGIWYTDSAKVMHCEVTRANDMLMRLNVPIPNEPPHEAISICGAKYFEIAYNYVHNCFKEGIDCKEVSNNGVIHHNYVHDIVRTGLYVDCWFGKLHHIELHSNVVFNCELGLCLGGEGERASVEDIFIHKNLFFKNRSSGFQVSIFGNDSPRNKIKFTNNTVFNNGNAWNWCPPAGGIDIRSRNVNDLEISKNLVFNNYGFQIASFAPSDSQSIINKSKNIRIFSNLTSLNTLKNLQKYYEKTFNSQVYSTNSGILEKDNFIFTYFEKDMIQFNLSEMTKILQLEKELYGAVGKNEKEVGYPLNMVFK